MNEETPFKILFIIGLGFVFLGTMRLIFFKPNKQ